MSRFRPALLPFCLLMTACTGAPSRLVVGDEPEGDEPKTSRDAGSLDEPDARPRRDGRADDGSQGHTEERDALAVNVVAVRCDGDCVDVRAVASGGDPPYAFRWEDGSLSADRRLCPTADGEYEVTVRDQGPTPDEFTVAPQTVRVPLRSEDLACAQAEPPADAGIACKAPASNDSPDVVTAEVRGMGVRYFHGGAALPAGRYRIEYVDGCMRWGAPILGYGWTIHHPGPYGEPGGDCELVGSSRIQVLGILPGITLSPGHMDYRDCVAANQQLAPLEIDFAGGMLGVFVHDVNPMDNGEGEGECGISPTWRLVAQ